MKNLNKVMMAWLIAGFTLSPAVSFGQIGGIKVKNPINTGGGKTTETTTTTTNTTSGTETKNSGTANATSAANINVSAPTVIMSSSISGTTHESSFTPGQYIFLRFAFPKPVGEFFAETIGREDVPSTGSYALAIAKNIDDENPIILQTGDIFTSRYGEDKVLDFVLQGDDALTEKLERSDESIAANRSFNSISTMAPIGLKDEWARKVAMLPNGVYSYEVFLVFYPWQSDDESELKQVASGKFTFTITQENRGKMAEMMNFYDRERFEKTPDDGMPTAIHKANAGKFVFSQAKMLKDFDNAGAVKTSFDNLSGGVYARLYLKESMRNFYANYGNGKDVGGASYSLYFYVDGKTDYSCYEDSQLSKEEALTMTSWSVPLAPLNDDDFNYDKECVNRFAYVISELTAGKHTIKIIAKAQYDGDPASSTPIAEGEFSINIDLADRDAFVKKYGLKLPGKGLLESDTKLYADAKRIAGPSAIDVRCPNVWENKLDAWGTIVKRFTIVCYSYKGEDGRCKQGSFMIEQLKFSSGWGETTVSNEPLYYGVDPYLPFQNSK
jgi:hypothetical protein